MSHASVLAQNTCDPLSVQRHRMEFQSHVFFFMSCCLNPDCPKPLNQDNSKFCQTCGTPLVYLLLDRFEVLKVIAQGGFGRTYLALDTQKLQEQCVLKQLVYSAPESLGKGRAESMFLEEAKKLQTLGTHPQIPALFAFFSHQERHYLVQEWIEGHTLKQELTKGPFSELKTRQVLADILPVLSFIHQKNVIHRDIKPENIMRHQATGKLVLIDFGISKNFCIETLTKTGTIVGSHGYSSREQIMEGKTSPRTDLFSLGVSCFHLMTLVSPLELSVNYGFSWIEHWRSHLTQTLTPEFEAIITKLLAVKPDERYHSAEEVLSALAQLPEAPTEINVRTDSKQHISKNNRDSGPTEPMRTDPFITQESSQSEVLDKSVQDSPMHFLNRRRLLKYLGLGIIGSGGSIIAWAMFGNRPRQQTPKNIPPFKLSGRSKAIGQYSTIKVDRSGNSDTPASITIELIREDLGNDIFLDLAKIQSGNFLMGSLTSEPWRDQDESPRHPVTLQSFLMGIYEVTQSQWQAVSQFAKVNIDLRVDDSTFKGGNRPVERVSWYEAVEFCQRLSQVTGHRYRLPTEAEWEYACRAGTTSPFAFGNTLTSTLANFDASSTYAIEKRGEFRKITTDVGEFFANQWGLHDMHGNVMEWCLDTWHSNYENAPIDGSAWIDQDNEKYRVLRGGSWFDPPKINRSANRSKKRPSVRQGDVGLRVVCEI